MALPFRQTPSAGLNTRVSIDVRGLTKKFGDFTAVDELSFTVREGEVFGLLGPNGAGKSTLIRMLTTLLPPTAGTATIGGFDVIRDAAGVRAAIGVIPQAMTSDTELSVYENLVIFAKLYRVPRQRREAVIAELLEAVELSQWAEKPVRTLSGGMRRRLEIARGLVHEPRIFFLDEPTTGLDPVSRVAVWTMLRKLQEHRRVTVLVTTHYMDEADRLCDRIAIIDHGKLVALDTPMRLKASVAGPTTLEVTFASVPEAWADTLRGLPGVEEIAEEDAHFRIATRNGPATTMALMHEAAAAGTAISALAVQSTTLDDVFVHFTGRQLRDEVVTSPRWTPPPTR